MSEWIDISVAIANGMIIYKGDPDVRLGREKSIADGSVANVSRLNFGAHSGTHFDTPVHFIEGGPDVESIPLDVGMGPAQVVDATAITSDLSEQVLRGLSLDDGAQRLLFKTPNSNLWAKDSFSPDFLGITEDGARYLVGRGVRLVGIDYLSIAPVGNPKPTHLAFMQNNVVILEGIDLRNVEPGDYELAVMPVLIP
ncbi:MAG: cyclase family protein, partial [Tepidiformaceae bacterium]